MRYKKKPIKEEEKRRKQQMREERVSWHNKIETKKVLVCLSCGQTFLTRIEPYYKEHKYCLSCVEDKDEKR